MGADTLIGGAGIDTLSYEASTTGINLNLATGLGSAGLANGDVVSEFEVIVGSAHNDTIIGSAANETIIGGAGADHLDGGEGVDQVSYALSNAGVNVNLATGQASGGHAQGDTVLNFEHVIGSNYNDTLAGTAGSDTLDGGSGNDYIYGSDGADSLVGGVGIDTLDYSLSNAGVNINLTSSTASGGYADGDKISGFEVVVGSNYADTLNGSRSDDTLIGGDGDDHLFGDYGNDLLVGGAGNDTLEGSYGNDTLDGGDGFDIVDYSKSTYAANIDLLNNTASGVFVQGDVLISIEGIIGSAYNDTLTAGIDAAFINAGAGNDLVIGGAGADTLLGGAGTDTLSYQYSGAGVNVNLATGVVSGGHAEGDIITEFEGVIGSSFNDTIVGSHGNDYIDGGDGADYLDGGIGVDTLSYASSSTGVSLNMATGHHTGGGAEGDTIVGFEYIVGSNHDDTFIGSDSNDVFDGSAGNDYVYGSQGSDSLAGGAGIDTIDYSQSEVGVNINLATVIAVKGNGTDTISGFEYVIGSSHDDTIRGTAASDTLVGGAGDDYIYASAGYDRYDGGEGFDIVDYSYGTRAAYVNLADNSKNAFDAGNHTLESIEGIIGTKYNDRIWGDNNDNYIDGGTGNDTLYGEGGNDTIFGGAGNDTIYGGTGDDVLHGGLGTDYLFGDEGFDIASYSESSSTTSGMTVNLATGSANGVLGYNYLYSIEGVVGTKAADNITGDVNNNYLFGGNNNDILTGGLGADTFAYEQSGTGQDVITDFCASDGDIILIETASGTGTVSVTDGSALVSGTAGAFAGNDVLVVRDGTNSYVYIDSDGDGNYNSSLDQSICLNNTQDIGENNILFTNNLVK